MPINKLRSEIQTSIHSKKNLGNKSLNFNNKGLLKYTFDYKTYGYLLNCILNCDY